MSSRNCPHCGHRLGNYLYADACPSCHRELTHNTRPLVTPPKLDPNRVRSPMYRAFLGLRNAIER
ncbi:hypothetical protein Oter_1228 [Opitutus terrae PB90-1]|uniref:Uncharacterized protein n=1 Tax=Opitutus terrae (strain DSM 11246 / JCM 15787 / PB90-1) TaxID=452637 RepID=B1ZPJ4_OPITP|nr:hypothetical protein Oter_1228 [Opitutus terrae PB90-1]